MHNFSFTVHVTLERESGKFMGRDEMEEQLIEALEGADPSSVEGGADGDSVYEVTEWEVEMAGAKPAPKPASAIQPPTDAERQALGEAATNKLLETET